MSDRPEDDTTPLQDALPNKRRTPKTPPAEANGGPDQSPPASPEQGTRNRKRKKKSAETEVILPMETSPDTPRSDTSEPASPVVPTPSTFKSYQTVSQTKKEVLSYTDPGKSPRPIKLKEIKKMFNDYQALQHKPPAFVEPDLRSSILLQKESTTSERTYWIDVQYPTPDTLATLGEMFLIHPLTIEDCLPHGSTNNQLNQSRQKHEVFGHYRFITYSEVHYLPGSNVLTAVDVNIIALSNVVITTHNGPLHCIDIAAKRASEKKHDDYPAADWIMYAIMDAICDNFFTLVEGLVMEISTLDELVLILTAGEQSDFLMRIGMARKRLTTLRTQLIKKRDIVHALVLSDTQAAASTSLFTLPLRKDIKIYLRDVLDHIYTMLDEIENSRETLGNLNNTYLARVSIEVAEASNSMNQVMKKLNAVTVLFLPLGVVAGLWGMNVSVPGQLVDEAAGETAPFPSWFIGIVSGMIVFSVIEMIIFKKLKWF